MHMYAYSTLAYITILIGVIFNLLMTLNKPKVSLESSCSCFSPFSFYLSSLISLASVISRLLVSLFSLRFHRITEWTRLEGTSEDHLVQPPCQAGSPRARCTGWHPGGFWISPEKKTPQPLCETLSPSQYRSAPPYSAGTSCASVCAHCLLSCRWVQLKRVWFHSLDALPSDIDTRWWGLPSVFSFPACPHTTGAPVL